MPPWKRVAVNVRYDLAVAEFATHVLELPVVAVLRIYGDHPNLIKRIPARIQRLPMLDLLSAAQEKQLNLVQGEVLQEQGPHGIGERRQAIEFFVVSFYHN